MPPRPGPHLDRAQRWFQEKPSEYAWEQDGLDHIKRLMPAAEPFRAWATFSFAAASGRLNECDLLIAVPGGLYLLELKGHPGRVENRGDTWSVHEPGRRWPRTLRNPLSLTDLKAKELKTRFEWAAKKRGYTGHLPRIEAATFLSAEGLVSQLDEVQATHVYGRDEASEGLPWVWRDLLSRPPRREHHRITPAFSRDVLPGLLREIGIRAATAHLRFGDDWTLDTEKLDAGETWEDRLARRKAIVDETGRVRIYLTSQQAGEERRAQVERAARREYQVLQGITHRGIAQPVQIREHQGRPAILFHHAPGDVRLDTFVDAVGPRLRPAARLDMVRQLAEAVRYAHSRLLYHRALSARSVYVSSRDDGSEPVLRVIDWQTAARDFAPGAEASVGVSSLSDGSVTDAAGPYLAPEFAEPFADPADLDVFGLGAIAYLVLTGQAPAPDRAGMLARLEQGIGLRPTAVDDALSPVLDDLIHAATRGDVRERLESADEFLRWLDDSEQAAAPTEPEAAAADPLAAGVGERVDGDWVVERILGTGSTARALLVGRARDGSDGSEVHEVRVLKVALDEHKAGSLHAEAAVLDQVGGGHVVRKLDGPRLLAQRTVVDLEYGGGADLGRGTLGALLREEGRLSYHDLERFGLDLFDALDQLAGKGVRHRDVKPDNLAVFRRADRSRQLTLLDFSLSSVSERDVSVGTTGYRDPFLGTARRPAFDDQAERYAAAVTLHEMASQQRPSWGDGFTDPRTTDEERPTVAVDEFDPALKDGLIAFFGRALHREVDRRFDTLRQMEDAWRAVFATADRRAPSTLADTGDEIDPSDVMVVRDELAERAALETALEAAGLSPRAVSVAAGYGAGTVGELLGVRTHELARARGAGSRVRKELIRRHKQWAPLLRTPLPVDVDPDACTVDELVTLLLRSTSKRPTKRDVVARVTLGLDPDVGTWPTQSRIATAVETTQATVSRHHQTLFAQWAEIPVLADARSVMLDALAGAGRIMTSGELAAAVRARFGAAPGPEDTAMRAAAAVVRAAVEAENWAGEHDDVVEGDGEGPRTAVSRRGDRVLVALESTDGADHPSPTELADYARDLGDLADRLVVEEPLPGPAAVAERLRAVPAPERSTPLSPGRMVALAAAASRRALRSPRGELYPQGLDLVTGLRLSQAAAGVRLPDPRARFATGITLEGLLARVRARFPAVVVPDGLTHVGMREALREAGFELVYDTTTERFHPPAPPSPVASSTSLSIVPPCGPGTRDEVRSALDRAAERGGFVALTVRAKDLPGVAAGLVAAYPVRPVDVGALFLMAFRALAAERGQDWQKVLATDARFSESGQLPRGLASYVRHAWDRTGAMIDEACAPGTVVLLHDAGLIARYADAGGRDLLVRLQHAARVPDRAPHGAWLLCPGASATASPRLDGMVVEKTQESEQVVLDRDAVDRLLQAGDAA